MEPFVVRITVRGYELDPRGHLNQAVYLQYSEHARWECLRAAGITHDVLHDSGVGPVALEHTIRYYAELRADDVVDVGCEFRWRDGKTFEVVQPYVRADATKVAELTGIAGLLDLDKRRLIPDPAGHLRSLATTPKLLRL